MQKRTPIKMNTASPMKRLKRISGTGVDPGLSMPAFSDNNADDNASYSNGNGEYKTGSEKTEVGYIEIDLSGQITSCNNKVCKILNQSREVLVGSNYIDHIHDKTAEHISQ